MSKILTLEEAKKIMDRNNGNLDFYESGITSLPEGLVVRGYLDISYTNITSLPKGLTVGNWLDIRHTGITSLPKGLTVGDWLDIYHTGITSLPEGLTVGGWLDICQTGITSLPEGLSIGGRILYDTEPSGMDKVHYLQDGEYVEGEYLYADGIFTYVKKRKQVGKYTVYVGKIPGKNVVSDGVHYAHCDKLRDGIADLNFKTAEDRGAEQYKGMSLDTQLSVEEAVTMYRIITGACRQGSENFVNSLGKLKEKYTISECIELTRGQYNSERFKEFFGEF